MAKILSFRGKENASSAQDFLTDETETLSFRTADDGAVSLGDVTAASLPHILPDPKRDWGNQELADLFRVKQLLSGANVPVETMRGVTDEGDPWFIFCHLNGDVFIHMARIDGTYVLDSPNVARPLRGHDFNALIADYTNHTLPAMQHGDAGDTEHRVVRFERGSKVRLHPSAMLAALIWTLFIASEELVMLAPEEHTATDDDLLDFSDVISADYEFHAVEMETADVAAQATLQSVKELHEEGTHNAFDAQTLAREAMMGQQGLAAHQNGFAMGLSTIAIAMGFMSETALLDNQRKVLDGLKALNVSQYGTGTESGAEVQQVAEVNENPLLEMLGEFLGLDITRDTEVAEAATEQSEGSLLQQDILHVTTAAVQKTDLQTQTKTVQKIVLGEDSEIEIEMAEASDSFSDQTTGTIDMQALVSKTSVDQEVSTVTISDLFSSSMDQLEEFQLGQTTVMASFDLSETGVLSLSEYIDSNQRQTDHREFDDHAQAFIDFINAKETDVGIIKFGNEVIMIDRDAFNQAGADKYTFSWETNDGHIISMIGLRSEFQEFDLIA
ncbi:hypothetical protein HKX32_19510 [Sulfitobacter sp. KE42]|uniref:hypothetical protein n=1 Tax=Sulfitobacter sp. KE42 TaxID=2731155 RepID=UPI0023E1D856|nr:hypothetical protein [Sulfitobacter sp. KE42]MDF3435201.1 hypothetical protein [Sulfitobacter sp. KE42]